MIEIIRDERAVFIPEISAVVIADMHLGYEESLAREGIKIPNSLERMIKRIRKILHEKNAEKLIILGDVKHSIGKYHRLGDLESLDAEIIIVKGNHDGGIESLIKAEVYPPSGFSMGDYGFIHGHSWPDEEVMRKKYVLMGHIHPEISLEDSLGKKHRFPCFLVGSLTETGREKYGANPRIFVLPAFNPMVGSSIADPIGPLLKNKIMGDFEVYLLNGTYLGKLEELQPAGLDV